MTSRRELAEALATALLEAAARRRNAGPQTHAQAAATLSGYCEPRQLPAPPAPVVEPHPPGGGAADRPRARDLTPCGKFFADFDHSPASPDERSATRDEAVGAFGQVIEDVADWQREATLRIARLQLQASERRASQLRTQYDPYGRWQ
jgi:hypothetical protein